MTNTKYSWLPLLVASVFRTTVLTTTVLTTFLVATPLSAQTAGAISTAPSCDGGVPVAVLGFSYYQRAPFNRITAGAGGGRGGFGGGVAAGAVTVVPSSGAAGAGAATAGGVAGFNGLTVRGVPTDAAHASSTGDYPPIRSAGFVFSEEPRITNVDESGPVGSLLQDGDYISRVNGYPITTSEGTAALRDARAGTSLVLTVRRGDRLIPVTIVPNGWHCAVTLRAGFSAPATVIEGRLATLSATTQQRTNDVAGVLMRAMPNAGWLGMGFDCSECGQRQTPNGRVWYFAQPPVIYNVDTGSPAYNAGIRRGDVLLRVDGKDVQSDAAGARLGMVRPGETLRLTYRRAGKTRDASLKVAASPIMQRGTYSAVVADSALSSARVMSTSNQARLRELKSRIESDNVAADATIKQLEQVLRQPNGNAAAREIVTKLRAQQEAQHTTQSRAVTKLLQNEQEHATTMNIVERQVQTAALGSRPTVVTLDSAVYARSARDQRLRFSGSVGGADIEVRGPGSVSVQGDGDDLVIVTGDAVIRIKTRKPTEHSN